MKGTASTGAVIIGRNEGERLRQCLLSVVGQVSHVVYVDSGSTDRSVDLAHELEVSVMVLDNSSPFTAARGRNAGFDQLMAEAPDTEYVQFIDGDCELMDGWLVAAKGFLQEHAQHAVVCGRLLERYPESSIYNRLCDLEWDRPVGDVEACGGIFMIRATAFAEVGGMNNTVVAGEEPEMCLRLRRKGWLISRLNQMMARHDAGMTNFRQWSERAVRSGYAYAHGYALHRKEREEYCRRASLRIWFWAFILPFTSMLLILFYDPLFILLFTLYLLQILKITVDKKNKVVPWQSAIIYSIFNIIGKFFQLVGQVQYMISSFKKTFLN